MTIRVVNKIKLTNRILWITVIVVLIMMIFISSKQHTAYDPFYFDNHDLIFNSASSAKPLIILQKEISISSKQE
jgi:hypothetical protein